MIEMKNRGGQATIFIIVALVIVAGILIFFSVRERVIAPGGVAAEFSGIYDTYSSCIEEKTKEALDLAGNQGGRIYTEGYVPGSEYAPYASQLNFLGFPVPYWYYIAGNGVVREQVPSKAGIEGEIARYVADRMRDCNYDAFYSKGYAIDFGAPEVKATIGETSVDVSVKAKVIASLENASAVKEQHDISVQSKFGKFYRIAREIYDKEKSEVFLEKYALDVLGLYAPVDGAEIGCAPKVWKTREVVDELKKGLEANIGALKVNGGYYTLTDKKKEYFVVDYNSDSEVVNFIYNSGWASKVEVNGAGAGSELMVAEPVGNKEGLGIMGFCYVPYHYVYDIAFPVMIQVYDSEEIFQFPIVVIIDKNQPRNALPGTSQFEEEFDLCEFMTQDVDISVYDISLNPIEANLSYICFEQECRLGQTSGGKFVGKAPQCMNGYLRATAGGYADRKIVFSTNSEQSAEMFMDREYDINLSLEVGGKKLDKGTAIVSFIGERSVSTSLPDYPSIKISEGLYNVSAYVYGNSSIIIPASTKRECRNLPRAGIGGMFGFTEEKCFDINLPETKIEQALIGGGRSEVYLLPENLAGGKLTIRADSLPMPKSLEELANNYAEFDAQGVVVE